MFWRERADGRAARSAAQKSRNFVSFVDHTKQDAAAAGVRKKHVQAPNATSGPAARSSRGGGGTVKEIGWADPAPNRYYRQRHTFYFQMVCHAAMEERWSILDERGMNDVKLQEEKNGSSGSSSSPAAAAETSSASRFSRPARQAAECSQFSSYFGPARRSLALPAIAAPRRRHMSPFMKQERRA